jgi:hypothetical protein
LGKYINWKPPKLYTGKRWWIEYQFRIPEELRYRYKGAKWKGFPVFEDINRYKTDEYARAAFRRHKVRIRTRTQSFRVLEQKEFLEFQRAGKTARNKEWSCVEAFNYFIQEWEQRGLGSATLTKLKRAIEVLTIYLTKHNLQHESVKTITREHVKSALRQASDEYSWSNRTFNNNKSALSTVFIFLESEKITSDNPTKRIEKKKQISKKHRNYDPTQFKNVRKVMLEDDPLTYFATKLIYYLSIRLFPIFPLVFVLSGGQRRSFSLSKCIQYYLSPVHSQRQLPLRMEAANLGRVFPIVATLTVGCLSLQTGTSLFRKQETFQTPWFFHLNMLTCIQF